MVACVVGRDRLVGEGDGRDLLAAEDDAPDGLDELDRALEGAPNLENQERYNNGMLLWAFITSYQKIKQTFLVK